MVYAILKFARFNFNKRTCNNCIAYATKFARQLTILRMNHAKVDSRISFFSQMTKKCV